VAGTNPYKTGVKAFLVAGKNSGYPSEMWGSLHFIRLVLRFGGEKPLFKLPILTKLTAT